MMVKRQYDHRIKAAIARSKNINLFPHLNIPKTTAKNWIQHGVGNVVTIDVFDIDREKLQLRCLELEDQNKALKAQLALSKFVSVTIGLHIQYQRFTGEVKKKIIDAIEVAKLAIPLSDCLETIGLSMQRFSNWLARQKTTMSETRASLSYPAAVGFASSRN